MSPAHSMVSFGSPAVLYLLSGTTLYSLDTGNGAATSVDSFTSSDTSAAMFSHGSRLFVGTTNSAGVLELTISGTGNDITVTAAEATLPHAYPSGIRGFASGFAASSDLAINASSGRITYTGSGEPVGTQLYTRVQVRGAGSTSVDHEAPVIVRAGNAAPGFEVAGYEARLVADAGAVSSAAVVTVTATDPEGDALTYSLRGSDPQVVSMPCTTLPEPRPTGCTGWI